jgi:hypothetical protein
MNFFFFFKQRDHATAIYDEDRITQVSADAVLTTYSSYEQPSAEEMHKKVRGSIMELPDEDMVHTAISSILWDLNNELVHEEFYCYIMNSLSL